MEIKATGTKQNTTAHTIRVSADVAHEVSMVIASDKRLKAMGVTVENVANRLLREYVIQKKTNQN